jgi:hypothetical protein
MTFFGSDKITVAALKTEKQEGEDPMKCELVTIEIN